MATLPAEQKSGIFSCCGRDGDGVVWSGGSGQRRKKRLHNSGTNGKEEDDYETIAKELNELSVQERERVLEDVHGVADEYEETPEFVTQCLKQLDKSISELSYVKRKELDRAYFLKPSIQTDRKFKLMFLRADHYNAQQAAERMARYFTHKLSMFGEDKLVKDITLDDLEDADIDYLYGGANLVLHSKDLLGRPIWFTYCDKYDFCNLDRMMRAFWYITMAVLEDEKAQTLGFASVMYIPPSGDSFPSPGQISNFYLKAGSVHLALPSRVTSFHFCCEDSRAQVMLSTIRLAFGKHLRLRVRAHSGSSIEMQYSLGSFGIRCQGLLADGKEKKDLIESYLQSRRNLEEKEERLLQQNESKSGVLIYPKPNDVLLGRGRPYQNFSGNRRFLEVVDEYMDRYLRCNSQFETSCLILDVVKSVQNYGGRFLTRTDEGWEFVSDKVARKKTGASFRTRNAKEKDAKEKEQQASAASVVSTSIISASSASVAAFATAGAEQQQHPSPPSPTSSSDLMMLDSNGISPENMLESNSATSAMMNMAVEAPHQLQQPSKRFKYDPCVFDTFAGRADGIGRVQ